MEAGRSAIVTAKNVQLLPLLLGTPRDPVAISKDSVAVPQECRFEFVACPSCVIEWTVIRSNFSSPGGCAQDLKADFVEITEPPYQDLSQRRACSTYETGKSKTRGVLIRFVFSNEYSFAFDLLINVTSKERAL